MTSAQSLLIIIDLSPPSPSSLINLQYGVIVRDSAIINVSFVGFGLSLIYSIFYYYYTSNAGKGAIWGKMGIGGAITAAVIAYAKWEKPENLELRFGLLMTVFMFGMVGAPLLDLGDIIRNKSVGQMPFAMILLGSIVSVMWLLYSIILNNTIMVVSINSIHSHRGSGTQLILCVNFRSRMWLWPY